MSRTQETVSLMELRRTITVRDAQLQAVETALAELVASCASADAGRVAAALAAARHLLTPLEARHAP